MNIQKLLIPVFVLSHLAASSAQAQGVVLIQKEGAVVSRSLSGHVDIGLENTLGSGVTVELYSPDWKTVLASTKTDDKGFFSLKKPRGQLFYMRLSSYGVDPYQLRVRVSKLARHNLHIHLTIAT
jgi:hypothetical protein